MKNILSKAALAALLTLGVSPLYAGSGHNHDHDHDHGHGHSHEKVKINEAEAKAIALKQVNHYLNKKKLEKSWLGVPVHNVEQKRFKSGLEWVVSYKNTKVKDPGKQVLYIFVSQYGKLTGANYTGK